MKVPIVKFLETLPEAANKNVRVMRERFTVRAGSGFMEFDDWFLAYSWFIDGWIDGAATQIVEISRNGK